MPTMMSQILSFADFTKTQKSKYLKNETLEKKKKKKEKKTPRKLHIKGCFMTKNSFVTFK